MGTEPCLQPGIPLTPAQLWSPATCAHRHNRALAYMGGLMTTIVSSCLHLPILRVQALFPTALDFLRVGGISDSIIKAKGERESSPPPLLAQERRDPLHTPCSFPSEEGQLCPTDTLSCPCQCQAPGTSGFETTGVVVSGKGQFQKS